MQLMATGGVRVQLMATGGVRVQLMATGGVRVLLTATGGVRVGLTATGGVRVGLTAMRAFSSSPFLLSRRLPICTSTSDAALNKPQCLTQGGGLPSL